MRIGFVSTFPPIECGIATYTKYLTDALKKKGNEIYVFSEYGGKGENVFSSYSSKSTDIADNIFLMASKMTPDILHIQHEFGLYGKPKGIQIIELILRCRIEELPVVTTFHTIRENLSREEEIVLRVILQESCAVIVHDKNQQKTLRDYFGYKEKIHIIPHGVREISEIKDARNRVGVKGKKVVLLCGYLRQTKRFDKIIRAFTGIANAVDNAILVVATKSRSVDHPEYQKEFYRMIEESPVADKIKVLYGQFPQNVFDTIISAADVVVLPYDTGAQSGIMAHCFAFSKPVVTSNLKGFRSWVEESQGGLVANSNKEIEQHIIKILKDDKFRTDLSKNIAEFVKGKVSWQVVAKDHIKVYEECAWRPTPKAIYFN